MEVMSPLDAAFLRLESRSTSLHIASVGIFDGPPPTGDQVHAAYASKLHLVPRYRQRVREVPLRLGRPVWVEDPTFDLGYHLRHTALPQPGSDAQLRELVGRLMSQQLDRGKPLWETWVVHGLERDRWAVVSKIHHCMVDGVAGTDLISLLLDVIPDPVAAPAVLPEAAAEPSNGRLLLTAVTSIPHQPATVLRGSWQAIQHPRRSAEQVAVLSRGAASFAKLAKPAAASSLSGPLGSHRQWGWTRATLDDVRTIRSVHGGTVNDVVLAAITRGFRDVLQSRGENPDPQAVRTLVPVSVRHEEQHGALDNRVSAMIADLPVSAGDPLSRLSAVRKELGRLKRSGEPQVGELVTSAAMLMWPPLLSFGLTGMFRLPHRHLITVATNVPGPQGPLWLCGRRLREYYPYVPLADRVRIGVAITSYDGVLGFGVTADSDSVPDLTILLHGIDAELRELLALAGTSRVIDLTGPRVHR